MRLACRAAETEIALFQGPLQNFESTMKRGQAAI